MTEGKKARSFQFFSLKKVVSMSRKNLVSCRLDIQARMERYAFTD